MEILEQLLKRLQQGVGVGEAALFGDSQGEMTPADLVTLQKGPQENRGFANIMQNLALGGAERRGAKKSLGEAEEQRGVDLDLKRAQAENLRSLGPWREGQLGLAQQRIDLQAERNEIQSIKNENDLEIKRQDLENKAQTAQAAMVSAQARQKQAQTSADKAEADKEFRDAKLNYDKSQDLINNALKRRAVEVQEGYLGMAEEAAPGKMAQTAAQTEQTTAETGLMQSDQVLRIASILARLLESGALTGGETRKGLAGTGAAGEMGLEMPEEGGWSSKVRQFFGRPEATAAPKPPTAPSVPKVPQPTGGKVVVKYQLPDGTVKNYRATPEQHLQYQREHPEIKVIK